MIIYLLIKPCGATGTFKGVLYLFNNWLTPTVSAAVIPGVAALSTPPTNSSVINFFAAFSPTTSFALSKAPLAANNPCIFANLKPNIPTNALPVCCIILDNADAVFEAFTKSLGLKVFLTSLTKSSINLNSLGSYNSFKTSLYFCLEVDHWLTNLWGLKIPLLLESLINFSNEAVLKDWKSELLAARSDISSPVSLPKIFCNLFTIVREPCFCPNCAAPKI